MIGVFLNIYHNAYDCTPFVLHQALPLIIIIKRNHLVCEACWVCRVAKGFNQQKDKKKKS